MLASFVDQSLSLDAALRPEGDTFCFAQLRRTETTCSQSTATYCACLMKPSYTLFLEKRRQPVEIMNIQLVPARVVGINRLTGTGF